MSMLKDALSLVGQAAQKKLDEELAGALVELRAAAPEVADKIAAHASKAKDYLLQGFSGQMDIDIALEAARRERDAIPTVLLELKETQARAQAARIARIVGYGLDLALTLATAAVRGAVMPR